MRNQILVVGGGMMGCGIAAIAAGSGELVTVVETNPASREQILPKTSALLDELAQNDLISSNARSKAALSITVTDDLEQGCRNTLFVIEAIVEDLQAKQELFATMDCLLPQEVVIVSNTSGLRITDISAKVRHYRQRMMTAHFWLPAHLVPLVEVVMSEYTDPALALWVKNRLTGWGKAPVIVKKDLPGQLANRILQAMIREASYIIEQGIATAEDVDTAVKMGMGLRFPVWGPLEHVDAVGVDLCERVQNTVLPQISGGTKANDAFEHLLRQGNLGYKTGSGFYDWSQKDMEALISLRNAFIIESVKFIRRHNQA